jgi:GNAT superfamily N-acetyltransferase
MINLVNDCTVGSLSPKHLIVDFDCGNADLNDFFNNDAIHYQNQWLCRTYFFRHDETGKIVCAFSLSADALKAYLLPNSRRKKVKAHVPNEKSMQSYPAYLIGRLGVASNFTGQGVGSQLMKFIMNFCAIHFNGLFRFLLVDAYNQPEVLIYYQKNDFGFVFSTEEQEREFKKTDTIEPLHKIYVLRYDTNEKIK